jgi:hypothetical protein
MTESENTTPPHTASYIETPAIPAVLDSELLLGLYGSPGKQSYLIMDRSIRVKVTQNELRELTSGVYRLPTLSEFHIMVEALQQAFPDGIYYLHGTQIDDFLVQRRGANDVSICIDHGKIRQFHGCYMGQPLDAILVRRPEPVKQMSEGSMLRKVNAPRVAHLVADNGSSAWTLLVNDVQVLSSVNSRMSWEEAQDMEIQINANFKKSQVVLDAERWKKLGRISTVITIDQANMPGSVLLRVTGQGKTLDQVLDSVRENKVL